MQPQPKTILLVDDDPDMLCLMTILLEDEGFKVSCLDNGSDVLPAVLSDRPDMIVLDVLLGDADGRDVCQQLKARSDTANIPVLILSASYGRYAIEKLCPADAYLSKPFDIHELISRVRRYARSENSYF